MNIKKNRIFFLLFFAISLFFTGCASKRNSFDDAADISEQLGDYKAAKNFRNMSKHRTGYTPVMAQYVEERRIPGATKYVRPAWVQERLDAEAVKVKSGQCSEHLSHLITGTDLVDPDIKEASFKHFAFLRKAFHDAGSNRKWLGMKGNSLTDEEYKINKDAFAKIMLTQETEASRSFRDDFDKLVVEKDLILDYQPNDFKNRGKAISKELDGLALNKDMSGFIFGWRHLAFSIYADLLYSAADINLECARINPPKS